MAIIRDPIVIDSVGAMPSLDVLIGSRVSSDIFPSVNSQGHKSFFGSEFDNMTKQFFQRHVQPMDQLTREIGDVVNILINPDRIRLMVTMDDFQVIPPAMELPILMYEPVRQLFMEGRVDGFGYDPTSLPDEDVYGRLINNFRCENVAEQSDADGYFDLKGRIESDDPDLSADELYAIRLTREYIKEKILDGTDRDPTCIELGRG